MRNVKPISAQDRQHVESLLRWAADAGRRGDEESSKKLYHAAHRVLSEAAAKAAQ